MLQTADHKDSCKVSSEIAILTYEVLHFSYVAETMMESSQLFKNILVSFISVSAILHKQTSE